MTVFTITLIISVPQGEIPKFIKSTDIISPLALYRKYLSKDMRGLLGVQFLAVLNIFLGSGLSISKNAMGGLFHNLSYQALGKDNDKYKLEFTAITLLVKSIIYKLEQKTAENKFKPEETKREIQNQLPEKHLATKNTEIEEIEQKVTNDIINDVTELLIITIYLLLLLYHRQMKKYIKKELKNQKIRDFETIENIDEENKKEPIKSTVEPSDGQNVNDSINPSNYTRDENNVGVPTNVEPDVIRVMNDIIIINNETLNNITSNEPKVAHPAPFKIEPSPVTLQDMKILSKKLTKQFFFKTLNYLPLHKQKSQM